MKYDAFENLSIGIIFLDTETGQIIYGNEWAKILFRVSDWNYGSLNWNHLVRRDISGEQEDEIKKQLKQYGRFKLEYCTAAEEKTLWYDMRGHLFFDEGKTLLCVTLMDITEYKQTERDLTHITQSVPGGLTILTLDEFLTVSYANSAYYEILGYTEREYWELLEGKAILTIQAEERRHFLESLHEQISVSSKLHLENWLIKKTGERVHISFDGSYAREENRLYCVLKDISPQKEIIFKLNEEMKLNKLIFGLSSDILFNLDLRDKVFTFSENVANTFHLDQRIEKFPNELLNAGIIAAEDIPELIHLSDAMHRGEKIASELRMRNKSGKTGWYCFEYDFLCDSEHRPVKAVGRITDVSGQRSLREKAVLDPLTSLYNKAETQNMIEKCIASGDEDEKHAFLIVDIDNFKGVNDTLGHHFGDMVLTGIAGKISKPFAKQNIVGRVGGDEFVIFLKNIVNKEEVRNKAEQIADAFRHTFAGERNDYKISGSIGISLFPEDGTGYEALYKNADSAMYESKRKGKDRYTFFNRETDYHIFSRPEPAGEKKRFDDAYYKEHLLYTVFDLLYETEDIYASVNKVLEIVGMKYDVDRCYIFEAADGGGIFNNTYEWCREGIEPQIKELQGLKRAELEYALCRYSEDGIFVCDDPSALGEELYEMLDRQGIKSMLHCGVPGKGEIKAIVGFDDCKAVRVWNEGELSTLTYISRLLGMYLINKEISDELRETNQNKNMLMDDMSGYVYVIDADTYEVLYLNKRMKEIATDAKYGDKCYSVAFGTDKPCENCPCEMLINEDRNVSREFYLPRYHLWTYATASRVKWIGCKNAVLLSCADITKYKSEQIRNEGMKE